MGAARRLISGVMEMEGMGGGGVSMDVHPRIVLLLALVLGVKATVVGGDFFFCCKDRLRRKLPNRLPAAATFGRGWPRYLSSSWSN